MHTPIPFKIQLTEDTIVLSGDLDGSLEVRRECERIAKAAVLQSVKWIVDAKQARLPRGGAEMWVTVVHKILGQTRLAYVPSQLAQNLEYDDEYRHEHSAFVETDDELGRVIRGGSWSEPGSSAAIRHQHLDHGESGGVGHRTMANQATSAAG